MVNWNRQFNKHNMGLYNVVGDIHPTGYGCMDHLVTSRVRSQAAREGQNGVKWKLYLRAEGVGGRMTTGITCQLLKFVFQELLCKGSQANSADLARSVPGNS